MVEGGRKACKVCHVVDRRISLCTRCSLFHQPVLLPELRDSIKFVGEIAAYRRLPVCVEGELRPTYTTDPIDNAINPTYTPRC